MLFRRLMLCAVVIGLGAGLLLGVGEQFSTAPLIAAAEQYETPHAHDAHAAAESEHAHQHDSAWAPADGLQRLVFTIVASIGVSIGFALLMLVAMAVARLVHAAPLSLTAGLAWGGAAFAVVFLAPALGLAPEVPGTAAAALAARQLWWIVTVLVAGAALWIAVFAPARFKAGALVLLPWPYLYGAPAPDTAPYAGHDAGAVRALEAIHQQFVWATAGTNLVLWMVLGVACVAAARRWIVPVLDDPGRA